MNHQIQADVKSEAKFGKLIYTEADIQKTI